MFEFFHGGFIESCPKHSHHVFGTKFNAVIVLYLCIFAKQDYTKICLLVEIHSCNSTIKELNVKFQNLLKPFTQTSYLFILLQTE